MVTQRKDFHTKFLSGEFKKVRLRLGMTQAELATALGLSTETVSLYDRDQLTVPTKIVRAMRSASWAHRKTPKRKPASSKGVSGVSGVVRRGAKWETRIVIEVGTKTVRKHLGIFDTVEEAIAALKAYKDV